MPSSNYYIIDGNGPFFRDLPAGRVNWSAIPFPAIERNGRLTNETHRRICIEFSRFCGTAAIHGFNAITLDDLAHLSDLPEYSTDLKLKLSDYRRLYSELIEIADRNNLGVWMTAEVMFHSSDMDRKRGRGAKAAGRTLAVILEQVFRDYPRVGGVVFRACEKQDPHATGDFAGRRVMRTPKDWRRFLLALLPVFEKHDRIMMFRTWGVGMRMIGDMMWSRETFHTLFAGIRSEHLLVSIKYGESDFYRYVKLHPLFRKPGINKVIELQARREFEGGGEYPAFIGKDCESYRDELRKMPGMRGICVWCQTGGPSAFRRLTFLDPDAVWNDINAWTCIRMFRDGASADAAVRSYFQRYGIGGRWDQLFELLQLSEQVIKELLYTDEFANRRTQLRRLRVPPLLSVYRDRIFISGAIRAIYRCFIYDGEVKVMQAHEALVKIGRMKELAAMVGLPVADIEFQLDTFRTLALARVYYYRPDEKNIQERLTAAIEEYRGKHGRAYDVDIDLRPWRFPRNAIRLFCSLLLHNRGRDSFSDRAMTIRVLSVIYTLSRPLHQRLMPRFLRKPETAVDVLLR